MIYIGFRLSFIFTLWNPQKYTCFDIFLTNRKGYVLSPPLIIFFASRFKIICLGEELHQMLRIQNNQFQLKSDTWLHSRIPNQLTQTISEVCVNLWGLCEGHLKVSAMHGDAWDVSMLTQVSLIPTQVYIETEWKLYESTLHCFPVKKKNIYIYIVFPNNGI